MRPIIVSFELNCLRNFPPEVVKHPTGARLPARRNWCAFLRQVRGRRGRLGPTKTTAGDRTEEISARRAGSDRRPIPRQKGAVPTGAVAPPTHSTALPL